jgi:hypothetical protein
MVEIHSKERTAFLCFDPVNLEGGFCTKFKAAELVSNSHEIRPAMHHDRLMDITVVAIDTCTLIL